jgi:protein-disulfide isomerase
MPRWFSVSLFQRSLIALFVLCLGCSAQSNAPTDLDRSIERQVRSLFQLPPHVEVQIGARRPSEFPNYDDLTVQLVTGGQKQEEHFLIAKDGKALVRFNKMDLTKDPYLEVMNKINLDRRPWRGNPNARVIIVSYDDFQCPFCSRMHQAIFGPIYQKYGDKVKIVYKDFPLASIHPWATRAAVDSHCLADQSYEAYWSYADYVHNNGSSISQAGGRDQQFDSLDKITRDQAQKFSLDLDKVNTCLKVQDENMVNASLQEGEQFGIQGTPVLFINGYKIDGALQPDEIGLAIDRALRDAGVAVTPAVAPAK